jgi:hypothetical protein
MKREPVVLPDASAGHPKLTAETEESGFLSSDQLLKRLPISRGTLRNWCANGSLPYIKAGGARRILFDWPSVREALLRRQRGGVA